MKRLILLALVSLALAGCATFSSKEVTYLRSTGLPPSTMAKLELGRPLSPHDIIALHSRGVPDSFVLRHLDDRGVDYLVTRSDLTRMRRAGVSAVVIDAVIEESESFAEGYVRPSVTVSSGVWYDDPWYHDPLYPGPRWYPSFWW